MSIDKRVSGRSEGPLTILRGLAGWLGRAEDARLAAEAGGESPVTPESLGVAWVRCYGLWGHEGPHAWQTGRFAGSPVGSCSAVLDLETGRVSGELAPETVAQLAAQRRRDEAAEDGHARALAVGRLSAAADDAEELARGLGADAVLWLRTVQGWRLDLGPEVGPFSPVAQMLDRVARCTRLAVRLARQAVALRESADDVQTAADLDGLCLTCGEPAREAGRPVCLRCWSRARGGAR